tara:strand:- start:260 stop:1225 length:966 start_codon:yes stop_codon:yes gene_type:complete
MLITKDYLKKILQHYDLGEVRRYYKTKTGVININIVFHTKKGKYILRIFAKSRNKEEILFETKLIDRLTKCNFPCPNPIRSNNGEEILKFKNRYITIFDFEEGYHVMNQRIEHVREIGKMIGKLHLITKEWKPRNVKSRYTPDINWTKVRANKFIKQCKIAKVNRIEDVEILVKPLFKKLNFPSKLPKGTLHNDIFRDNVLFLNSNINCILDFDDAHYGPLIHDLSTAIQGWCFPKEKFNEYFVKALIYEYQKTRKLNNLEKKYLFDSLIFITIKHGISLLQRPLKNRRLNAWNVFLRDTKQYHQKNCSIKLFIINCFVQN